MSIIVIFKSWALTRLASAMCLQYSDKAGIVKGMDVLRWRRQARK